MNSSEKGNRAGDGRRMRWNKRIGFGRGFRDKGVKKLWRMIAALGIFLVLGKALTMAAALKVEGEWFGKEQERALFSYLWNYFYPAPAWEGESGQGEDYRGEEGLTYVEQVRTLTRAEDDPAYRSAKAAEAFFQEHQYLEIYGGEESGGLPGEGIAAGQEVILGKGSSEVSGSAAESGGLERAEESVEQKARTGTADGEGSGNTLAASGLAYPGRQYSLAQLEDYDFLMKTFYSVHTSTTADREVMDVKKLLSRDFRLNKEGQAVGEGAPPQILIYHTHSKEAFADSKEGETIVAVGDYLAECLTERGFSVYHDSSAYDVREGKLDRNKAYTYALEGLTEILEKNPSIQVVIDLHRDGVGANTHLVTEINQKPTAQIMFFNGMSQTPDGPIPYLENPYREDNLSFSLQLQLKASAWYPGLTRKIYLKGLRYNQHLRPCSCLVEVGAQTNTFQEAKNAMEPLADIFSMVLLGK